MIRHAFAYLINALAIGVLLICLSISCKIAGCANTDIVAATKTTVFGEQHDSSLR
jgi:hypothetical protein